MQITLAKMARQLALLVGSVRKSIVPVSDLQHQQASRTGEESYHITLDEDQLIAALRIQYLAELDALDEAQEVRDARINAILERERSGA